MRPRLAFLALLLLALCSTASSFEVQITSWTSVSPPVERATVVTTAQKETVVKKSISAKLTPAKIKELDGIMGNTLFAIVLKSAGKFDALPPFYKNAIGNGILCEFTTDLHDKIKKVQYDHATDKTVTAEEHQAEKTALEADPELKKLISCPGNECFCGGTPKALLYCLAEAMKPAGQSKTCRVEAITALKKKGILGEIFAGEKPNPATNLAEGLEKMVELCCGSLDDTVEAAVKAVYAADALYWTAEIAALVGLEAQLGMKGAKETDDEFDLLCANADFKASKVGACLCGLETGFTYCMLKGISNLLKEIGLIDCKSKTVDKTKAPTEKQMEQKMAALVGAKVPGGPDAAATSSLLLLPLSVAAALLLRH